MSTLRRLSAMRTTLLISGCLALVVLASFAGGPLGAAATTTRPTPTPLAAGPSASPTPARAMSITQSPTHAAMPALTATPPAAESVTPPTGTPASLAEPLDPPELRAVWVDAFHDGFKTPAQVDDLVAWARSANLNALFVQVRRRGDAYYVRSFEPRTEDPDLAPGFDALQYLIDRAHQGPQRLQVHAWLATLPIWWQRDSPPQARNHPFNTRGLSAGSE